MHEEAKERTCRKSLVVFLFTLSVLTASARNGLTFAQPPDNNSPSAADEFNALSKDIQQSVKSLGYTDDVDIDLVQMIGNWKYMDWMHTLGQARQDFQQKKISAEQLLQVEEETLKELCQKITKRVCPGCERFGILLFVQGSQKQNGPMPGLLPIVICFRQYHRPDGQSRGCAGTGSRSFAGRRGTCRLFGRSCRRQGGDCRFN